MRIVGLVLLSVCLFAQGDAFTPTSGMGFSANGAFSVGMEFVPATGAGTAIRTQTVTDQAGVVIFPRKLTFAGTFTYRPTPQHKTAVLARIWISGSFGSVMVFNQNLTTIVEAVNVEVPQQTWNIPISHTPLEMECLIGMAGQPAPTDAEIELAGQWE